MFKISSKGISLLPIIKQKKETQSESKRRVKEHQNLSTSKESIGLKISAR